MNREDMDIQEFSFMLNPAPDKITILNQNKESKKNTAKKDKSIFSHTDGSSFKSLADSIAQLVWTATPEGVIDYCNKACIEYTGLDILGHNESFPSLFHPDDFPKVLKNLTHSMKTGEPYELEYRLRQASDNHYRWFLGRSLPVRNDKGEIVKWVGTATDIHKQKRSAELHRFLSETSTVLFSSIDYEITLKNIAHMAVPFFADWCAVDIYNENENKIERIAVSHVNPEKRDYALEFSRKYPIDINGSEGIAKVIKTGIPEFVPEVSDALLRRVTCSKEHYEDIKKLGFVSCIMVPIYSRSKVSGVIIFIYADSGRIYSTDDLTFAEDLAFRASLAIENAGLYKKAREERNKAEEAREKLKRFNDELEERVEQRTQELLETNRVLQNEISERKKIASELSYLNSKLEEIVMERTAELMRSNEDLEKFAYIASHDLQMPLHTISRYSGLIIEDFQEKLEPDVLYYLDKIMNASKNMRSLIEGMLEYSRICNRSRTFLPTDLNKAIIIVMRNLETNIFDKGAEITYDPLPEIKAERYQITSIFQNLISNALKYNDKKPVIHISAVEKENEWIFSVKDNGIGINNKYFDKIFELFHRLHRKNEYDGTGIGLSVCKKIAEFHNGTVWIESEEGAGSTFYFSISKNL